VVVVVKQVVGVFSARVFGVPRQQQYPYDSPEDQHNRQIKNGLIDCSDEHDVFVVLLEYDRRVLVEIAWNEGCLNALPTLPRKPFEELHNVQSREGYPDRGRVVVQLDEDVDEDELAQQEEVIEDNTHAHKK
jgi:hypothetical protein